MNATKTQCSLTCLILILCILVGCGKKDWPKPLVKQDVFQWGDVQASLQGNCLYIQGSLTGASQNLDRVRLEIEAITPGGEQCTACPFQANEFYAYRSSDPDIKIAGRIVELVLCGKSQSKEYRVRLVGENAYRVLGEVPSPVVIVKKQGR